MRIVLHWGGIKKGFKPTLLTLSEICMQPDLGEGVATVHVLSRQNILRCAEKDACELFSIGVG